MAMLNREQSCLFGFGIALVLIGTIIGGCWIPIYELIRQSELSLSPTSTSYKIWGDVPIPIYMEFYMFNWTNAAEVEADASIKPHFVEMGPYVFREYHKRVDMVWNNNNTITYRQVRTWQFEPDMTVGSLDDSVTNINIIAATTAYSTRSLPLFARIFISKFIDKTNSTLFVTKTVRELLFDGYDDLLLDLAKQINSTFFNIPFDKFGYFVERNGSAAYDGWFNMYTGADNIEKVGILHSWNFEQYTPFYKFPCNEVRGTSGELLPPVSNHSDNVIFSPDVCLSLTLGFDKNTERLGLQGFQYTATERTLDNGELYPEAECQNFADKDQLPRGTLNISLCRFDAPLFLSFPHFYMADKYYIDRISGMNPSKEKHEFQFAMNPVTGVPLYTNARMQLNVMIHNFPNMRLFSQFKERLFLPAIWFNQKALIDDDLASKVKLLVNLPQIGYGIFFGLAIIGAALILVGFICTARRGWKDDREKLVGEN